MFTKDEVLNLVKKGFINGSVYQCDTQKEFDTMEYGLLCSGWERVFQNGALTSYVIEKDGQIFWYSLIF